MQFGSTANFGTAKTTPSNGGFGASNGGFASFGGTIVAVPTTTASTTTSNETNNSKKGKGKGPPPRRVEKKGTFPREFFNILFPSQEDTFRVVLRSVAEGGVLFWMENKKSKQQWQVTVKKVDEHGTSGIPEGAVMAFLQKALETIDQNDDEEDYGPDDPTVDLSIDKGEATLILTLSMGGGIWMPQYKFTLLPVALDKHDVLEAKLRDAMEAIEAMKVEIASVRAAPPILSLSSHTATAVNAIVAWNGTVQRTKADGYFKISEDLKQVTIGKTGLYQVYVRLAGCNNVNSNGLGLQRNGVDIAVCLQSDHQNHQNSQQLLEVVQLSARDVLQIRCGAQNSSIANAMANRFTITFLE